MSKPLVSVICLCYNQEKFVEEAVQSVLNQSYPNVEIILIDDASTDGSQTIIQQLGITHPEIKIILLNENVGNCKAFNIGLAQSTGEYLIDLAADDILLPTRVEEGVKILETIGEEYGAQFSDADIIDEGGNHLYFHSDRFRHSEIPQGEIYKDIISRYFICPPTIICHRYVMNALKGYDESLSYEDFDFLIRTSRNFKLVYLPTVLVKKRITNSAMSKKQFVLFSKQSSTTYHVCKKILVLNKSRSEKEALRKRIFYEIRLNLRLLNLGLVIKYFLLLLRNSQLQYDN